MQDIDTEETVPENFVKSGYLKEKFRLFHLKDKEPKNTAIIIMIFTN